MGLFDDAPLTEQEQEYADDLQSRANVARAILHGRLALGLTQMQLARLADTRQSRVSELESMLGDPRLSTVNRVARSLNLVVDLRPKNGVYIRTRR